MMRMHLFRNINIVTNRQIMLLYALNTITVTADSISRFSIE